MRVLVAPGAFGAVGAVPAAGALASGWNAGAPHDSTLCTPLSDGGPGFLDALAVRLATRSEIVTVRGPLGEPVPAELLIVEEPGGSATAYLEATQACGLHLLDRSALDPWSATSYGVGELLEVARSREARRVVVGVGAAASHDAGAGLLAALGAGEAERLGHGAARLADLASGALEGLAATRERYRDTQIVLACAEEPPLLGLSGASALHAARAGADGPGAQELEGVLAGFAEAANAAAGLPLDLATGRPLRAERTSGAGAGGGLAYALLLLGARALPGPAVFAQEIGLDTVLRPADLVLTGVERFDWRSLAGSVVTEVARRSQACGTPVVLLAEQVRVGRREAMAAGLSGCYQLDPAQVVADPLDALADRAERLAVTWSPGSR